MSRPFGAWQSSWPSAASRRARSLLVVVTGTVMAVFGGDLGCLGGGTALAQPVTRTAAKEIPPGRLRLYRAAGQALRHRLELPRLDRHPGVRLAATCAGDNGSGCAGPMQIADVRESPCSPGSGPTLWERFGLDANGDGVADVNDPADAIFAAARILRVVMHAPPAGGSYSDYRQAACNYYGACADGVASYADEVMSRAVSYGFRGSGSPPASEGDLTQPTGETQSVACVASTSSASGTDIVRIAESQLGYTESPPGSNCTRYGPCVEWCSLFVAWVWERAGVSLRGGTAPYAYSGSIYEWAKAHGGRVLPPSATPSPGDAVFFGSGPTDSAHVGIVERVFPDGEIVTIDGNYGNRVARVGPFPPARAVASGEPAPIYGYAEPPSPGAGAGGVSSRA